MKSSILTDLFFKLLFCLSIPLIVTSCGGGSDDPENISPKGDYIKFKLDGKDISIIEPDVPLL